MVDDNILKPGSQHCHRHHDDFREMTHLFKENYLSEFSDEELVRVRKNLDVISKSELPDYIKSMVNYLIYTGDIKVNGGTVDSEQLKQQIEDAVAKSKDDLRVDLLDSLRAEIADALKDIDATSLIKEFAVWQPTGPVETSVGFIEDDYEFKEPLTLQQLADKIFYDADHSSAVIFIGAFPTLDTEITKESLKDLVDADPENNSYNYFNASVQHRYNFLDPKSKYLVAIVPESFPELISLNIGVQEFGIEAFKVSRITMLNEDDKETNYRVYVYKQGLVKLSSSVIFRFISNQY